MIHSNNGARVPRRFRMFLHGRARMSPGSPPLKHRNLNVLGHYSFTASVPRGGLRPLRGPDAVGLDDDDDGGEDV
ncbi:hypothetical protein N5079_22745 [Planotetraspora sp. A-T 1434]|uniref:hypothetical protein n=1 Tax=Planotetraspora sp. A-T 1434 TaxID=2979219 RepID=UPI0021BEBE8D|nr:hypothetical protein [Planotetraspora sp. A-T 1434]MCT9933031.1 hypothetical protein [Planotetraspora sp. A-T 1434]